MSSFTNIIWDRVKSMDFTALLKSIPDDPKYTKIKQNALNAYNDFVATNAQLNTNLESTTIDNSRYQTQNDAFQKLQTEWNDLQNIDQIQFDNTVNRQYIFSLNNPSKPTFFTDWYLQQLKDQYQNQILQVNQTFLQTLAFLLKELDLKTKQQSYQTFMLELQKGWFSFLTNKISENQVLLEQLQQTQTTEQRRSRFFIGYSNTLMTYSKVLFFLFWMLVVAVVGLYVYKKYFIVN